MEYRGFEAVCTRDEARKYFKDLGLSYSDITDGDITILAMFLQKEFKESNKKGETSINTMRLSDKYVIKHKLNGTITECYLYVNSHYFTRRECLSFNRDGFIGIAGWADIGNANPIKRAFLKWCDMLADTKTPDDCEGCKHYGENGICNEKRCSRLYKDMWEARG